MEAGQASRSGDKELDGAVHSDRGLPPRLIFNLTAADLLRAYRFHRNRYTRRWLWSLQQLFVLALLGIAVLIYVLAQPYVDPIRVALVVAGLLWVLYGVLSLTFWPYLSLPTRRRIRAEQDKRGESTVDLDETGVRLVTPNSSTVARWDSLRGYAESNHAFLLYPNDSQFAVIPKEMLTLAACDRIRALLSGKLRPR